MADPHCIESLQFDVDFGSAEHAFEEQNRVAAFARARAPKIIDEVFDRFSQAGQVWRLASLEIDLGHVDQIIALLGASHTTEVRGRALRDVLREELAAVFREHEAEPLCNRLLAAGLPAGPVQKIDQALTSPHALYRGDIIEKDWYKGVASPIRLERSKPSLRRTPPTFSQHATEVLGEFGYSTADIEAMVADGVVCGPERKR